MPVLAGSSMFCASRLPWLNDPLGNVHTAWDLPVDIGWQFHISIINYGLLSLCCAFFSFTIAFASWKPFRAVGPRCIMRFRLPEVGARLIAPVLGSRNTNPAPLLAHRTRLVGCLCLLPMGLFLLQYLCADLVDINLLAEHSKQLLFMQQHFGYATAKPLIHLNPLIIDISTIQMRFQLLVNQISIGPLLSFVSGCMLIAIPKRSIAVVTRKRNRLARLSGWLLFICALVVLCGRAPASVVCEQQAKALLAQGDYQQALQWLDRAAAFNPMLNQVAYYHIERGEALYFLQPDQQSIESQLYLASAYIQQRSTVNAYRQLYPLWQAHQSIPWVANEMSNLLERLSEKARPLSTLSAGRLNIKPLAPALVQRNDEVALSWLAVLSRVDPSNVYSHYMIGRIDYDLHNYAASISQMTLIIGLSSSSDIQSSAYTYIALSDAGQGDYIDERTLLLKAIALDPAYWNNTAREELSGLH